MIEGEVTRNSNASSSNATNGHTGPSLETTIDLTFKASVTHVYLLGMSVILGGFTNGWNEGFEAGLWGFFIDVCIVGLGYMMLACCLAEMTSIVTFTGGAYGYVRSAVGPYFGFMTGCFELLMYNFYTICAVKTLGECITESQVGIDSDWLPIIFLGFYSGVIAFYLRGGFYFWVAMCVLAAVSIFTIFLFCLSAFTQGEHYWKYSIVDEPHDFIAGGGSTVIHMLFKAGWFFIGIESISVAGGRIQDATKVVPRAILWCFISILILAFWVFFATAFQYQQPGEWSHLLITQSPMSLSWHASSGISRLKARLLTMPADFASSLGFIYGSMHSLQAMSLSGLMPAFFQPGVGPSKVPLRALVFSAIAQWVLLVMVNAFTRREPFYPIVIVSASVVYIGIFAAFLIFRTKFSGMTRGFYSPFGMIGAGIGILIFSLVLGSVVAFDYIDFFFFLGFTVLASIYYFAVVESRQFFSLEEQKDFMKAYILNANKKKKLTPTQRFIANLKTHLCWFNASHSAHTSKSKTKSASPTKSSTVQVTRSNRVGVEEKALATVEEGGDRDNDKDDGEVRAASNTAASASSPSRAPLINSLRNNSVAPAPSDDTTHVGAFAGDQLNTEVSMKSATNQLSSKSRRSVLEWSGKAMNIRESQTFFQLLHEDVAEGQKGVQEEEEIGAGLAEMVATFLPDQFQAVEVGEDGQAIPAEGMFDAVGDEGADVSPV